MNPRYQLIITDDRNRNREVPVSADEFTIGRKPGQGLRLDDENVSRVHARLRIQSGRLLLDDLSRYGTLVNGNRVKGVVVIKGGDVIRLGDYSIRVQMASSDQDEDTGDWAASDTTLELDAIRAGGSDDPEGAGSPATGTAINVPHLLSKDEKGAARCHILGDAAIELGSSPDNDIVLDHPSISPHHAKILFSGRHYSILSLPGAGQVKVNGDEVGAKDLQSGDQISLGQVVLHFINPSREAGGTGEGSGARVSLKVVLAASALLATLGAVLVIVMLPGPAGRRLEQVLDLDHGSGVAVIQPGADQQEPLQESEIPPEPDDIMALSRYLIEERDWHGALQAVRHLLDQEEDHLQAAIMEEYIEEEIANRALFRQLTEEAALKNNKAVVDLLDRINEDSAYRGEAERIAAELRHDFNERHLQAATDAYENNEFDLALVYLETLLREDPANREALRLRVLAQGAIRKAVAQAQEGEAEEATPAGRRTGRDARAAAPAEAPSGSTSAEPAPAPAPSPVPLESTTGGAQGDAQNRRKTERRTAPREEKTGPAKATGSRGRETPTAITPAQRRDRAQELYASGRSHFRNGKHHEARRDLLRSVQFDPSLGDPHFFLGRIYLDENQVERACHHLNRLLRMTPDSRHAQGAREAVSRIDCP